MVTTIIEPSKKYCFPYSNTSSPIYYKEDIAVKEWEVSSSTAASQGLHEANLHLLSLHLHFTCCRNPLPRAIKPKLLQKVGHGNSSHGIPRGFAGQELPKNTIGPLCPGYPGDSGPTNTLHIAPGAQSLHWSGTSWACPFLRVPSPPCISFYLHFKALSWYGPGGWAHRGRSTLPNFSSLQAFPQLGCLLLSWK